MSTLIGVAKTRTKNGTESGPYRKTEMLYYVIYLLNVLDEFKVILHNFKKDINISLFT